MTSEPLSQMIAALVWSRPDFWMELANGPPDL